MANGQARNDRRTTLRRAVIPVSRLMILAAALILLLNFFPYVLNPAGASGLLHLPLYSSHTANYSQDGLLNSVPQVNLSIIRDLLRDLSPRDPQIDSRITAVYNSLLTPVATSTPRQGETLILPRQTATDQPSSTPALPATATAIPATATALPSLTASPAPSATLMPTHTVVVILPSATPSEEPTATRTASPIPSKTPRVNHPPVIQGPASQVIKADQAYSFTPSASDPDGDGLVFSISGAPGWVTFHPASGGLSGTPTNADVGTSSITIRVSDGVLSASLKFTLRVTHTNHAPLISGPAAQSVSANSAYTFTPTASDPDGDPLTFSITNPPTWATFNPATGSLSGTPSNADVGTSSITLSVSDGLLSADLAFSLTVTGSINHPPLISGPATQSVPAGSYYSFLPTTIDPDGDTLIFSIAGAPSWLSFIASTGAISGTPGNGDRGVSDITISVWDGTEMAQYSFTLTVTNANHPPVIGGAQNQSTPAGEVYAFTPSSNDPDGDPLTFSVVNQPGWASFDPNTGTLSGTPSDADIGPSTITILVSDGWSSADFTFVLTVTVGNPIPGRTQRFREYREKARSTFSPYLTA